MQHRSPSVDQNCLLWEGSLLDCAALCQSQSCCYSSSSLTCHSIAKYMCWTLSLSSTRSVPSRSEGGLVSSVRIWRCVLHTMYMCMRTHTHTHARMHTHTHTISCYSRVQGLVEAAKSSEGDSYIVGSVTVTIELV